VGDIPEPEVIRVAEKIRDLKLNRDYKKYLYYLDGEGNVWQKPKSSEEEPKILVPHAVERDNNFLYFIDKEGDVSRSPRSTRTGRKTKEKDKKVA
jgi:hypothetical protein